mmetsp:Transcript_12596/g.18909  ORF Transcript_12596/g.18909 Transcript_12596/m.18909 type:complete len:236 (-) Transcript_12596:43-750(-)
MRLSRGQLSNGTPRLRSNFPEPLFEVHSRIPVTSSTLDVATNGTLDVTYICVKWNGKRNRPTTRCTQLASNICNRQHVRRTDSNLRSVRLARQQANSSACFGWPLEHRGLLDERILVQQTSGWAVQHWRLLSLRRPAAENVADGCEDDRTSSARANDDVHQRRVVAVFGGADGEHLRLFRYGDPKVRRESRDIFILDRIGHLLRRRRQDPNSDCNRCTRHGVDVQIGSGYHGGRG